jgi:hypothetical protein
MYSLFGQLFSIRERSSYFFFKVLSIIKYYLCIPFLYIYFRPWHHSSKNTPFIIMISHDLINFTSLVSLTCVLSMRYRISVLGYGNYHCTFTRMVKRFMMHILTFENSSQSLFDCLVTIHAYSSITVFKKREKTPPKFIMSPSNSIYYEDEK